jgi:hypothetical protein
MVCCVFVCNMWKAAGMFADIGDEVRRWCRSDVECVRSVFLPISLSV